jgi:hypothetical protein
MNIIERLRKNAKEPCDGCCYGETMELAADEIERLRMALLAITKCDDDGYGPDGYCANIARAVLERP